MSSFTSSVVRVIIEPHPNADAIELANVGGYVSIVKKGQFKTGDLAVYLQEQSVLPDWLLKKMSFWNDLNNKGMLAGSAGNRVKAIRLRGIFSQGILMPLQHDTEGCIWCHYPERSDGAMATIVHEGQDVAEILGVTKYEPAVPVNMAGKVAGGDLDATIGYDFENLKRVPDLFENGEDVVMTEKLHGTCLQVGIIPKRIWEGKNWADKCPDVGDDFKGVVTSKGQGAKGLMLDPSDEGNLYVGFALKHLLWSKLQHIRREVLGHPGDMPLFLLGEIYGGTVQDLSYGITEPAFRAFDIYAGTRDNGFFAPESMFVMACQSVMIDTVPVLYRGPFSQEAVNLHTSGLTTLQPQIARNVPNQIREGIVIKSTQNTRHKRHGRKIAKSVSEAYLLRKNATEYT